VAGQLGVEAEYVVGGRPRAPVRRRSFDAVFSYSVLQHLAKEDVPQVSRRSPRAATGRPRLDRDAERVRAAEPRPAAASGFSAGTNQDVRYWTLVELRRTFGAIGPISISADGFLTINPQTSDLDLLSPRSRAVVRVSEGLRRASERLPLLVRRG
jgi:hypothetical protein